MSRTIRSVKHAGFLRHPRTFPEHRDAEACKVEGFKKRAKRKKRRLPSAWDDKIVAAQYEVVKNPKKRLAFLEYHMYW